MLWQLLFGLLVLEGGAAADAEPAARIAQQAGRTITEVRDALQIYESRVSSLVTKYSRGQGLSSVYQLQSRINDGLVFFQLAEYEKASILLMDVVQDPKNKDYIGYNDALFHLAESLFLLKNPIAATQFYQLVVDRGQKQFRKESLLRLIEIGFETNRLNDIDRFFALLAAEPGGGNDPRILYVHAKSLYFRNRLAEATQEFGLIPPTSEHYQQARYFLGTILVRNQRYDEALPYFQEVVSALSTGRDAAPLKALGHLALGRLYFEQGRYAEAAQAYEAVPKNGPYNDRALYEVGWTYIKQGDHQQALRALDILLLASPDSSLAPEATLLKGNLQLKLTKYADAQSTFQEIVERFGPVREQLEQVLREHADPETFFQQLLRRNQGQFAAQLTVPPLAASWVQEEEQVQQAIGVVRSIDTTSRDLDEVAELIGQLEDALTVENRIEIFPELNGAWKTMLEAEHTLILLKRRLIEEERKLIWDSATVDERARYTRIAEQRVALEERFQQIPVTVQGMAKREALVEGELTELELQAFRLEIEIDNLQAQLVAVDKWVTDTVSSAARAKGSDTRVRSAVVDQQQELRQLEAQLAELRKFIQRHKVNVGIGDRVGAQESEVKRRYDAILAEEAQLLQTLRPRLGPESLRLMTDADALRQRIEATENQIRSFYSVVGRAVDQKVRELSGQVEEEKKLIGRYTRQAEGFQGMGENLAGRVAANGMQLVQTKFRTLVLQADVGIIDVAWQKKEEKSQSYTDMVKERKGELESLDAEFRPVLEEKL